jgi:tryptophan-rich sensory protein
MYVGHTASANLIFYRWSAKQCVIISQLSNAINWPAQNMCCRLWNVTHKYTIHCIKKQFYFPFYYNFQKHLQYLPRYVGPHCQTVVVGPNFCCAYLQQKNKCFSKQLFQNTFAWKLMYVLTKALHSVHETEKDMDPTTLWMSIGSYLTLHQSLRLRKDKCMCHDFRRKRN